MAWWKAECQTAAGNLLLQLIRSCPASFAKVVLLLRLDSDLEHGLTTTMCTF